VTLPSVTELSTVLEGPAVDVAPLLLGAVLRHGEVACRLTEVEAYAGAADPGSHSFRGETPRNRVMFGPPGRLYVYFTYGMHFCANVVCGPVGEASAVLLRAGEIVDGQDLARQRRTTAKADRDLARGPALLCQALGIDLSHYGHDLTREPLTLTLPADRPARFETGPRVGLRLAADRPWRFWLPGEPSVSSYRPAVPRRRQA
jgi:DNA-3-methyladenine glycosylase